MAVTAKIKVASKNTTGEGDDQQATLSFYADYADDRNKEWAKYTPALNLTMTVNGVVADKFQPGQAYTLTFTLDHEDDPAESAAVEASEAAAPDAPAV